jgi:hypothetical protein
MHLVLVFVWLVTLVPASTRAQTMMPDEAADNDDDEIVYIDGQGFIRVVDPSQSTGQPLVTWASPTDGWRSAALGDFNADGDEEIVAISFEESGNRLIIYDPVVAFGSVDPDNNFGGNYWAILYETTLPGEPRLVATGNFETAAPADEIVVVYDDAAQSSRRKIQILVEPSAQPTGSAWRELAAVTSRENWSDIATGPLEGGALDNLVLVDESVSALVVYRLASGALFEIFRDESESKIWNDARVGLVKQTRSLPQLVAVRRVDPPLPALVTWQWDPGKQEFVDFDPEFNEAFDPAPRYVFLAETVSARAPSGAVVPYSQVFLLRDALVNQTIPQLIGRNFGDAVTIPFEVRLTTGATLPFRAGTGADFDGDGKISIAVLSRTTVRIFDTPATATTFRDIAVESDGRTIVAGNLDAKGSAQPDSLAVTPTRVEVALPAGTQDAVLRVIAVTNGNYPTVPISFAARIDPAVPFAQVAESAGETPGTVTLALSAAELLPGGVYGSNLIVTATQNRVVDTPQTIPFLVRTQDGIVVRPTSTSVTVAPCTVGNQVVTTRSFEIVGTPGSTFSATVVPGVAAAREIAGVASPAQAVMPEIAWPSSVPWVTAVASGQITVPTTLTLTIDPARGPALDTAQVVIDGRLPNGTPQTRRATVSLTCAEEMLYLPFVGK